VVGGILDIDPEELVVQTVAGLVQRSATFAQQIRTFRNPLRMIDPAGTVSNRNAGPAYDDRSWPAVVHEFRVGPDWSNPAGQSLEGAYLTIAGLPAPTGPEDIRTQGRVLGMVHRLLAFPSGGLPTIPTPLDSPRVMDGGEQ